MNDKNTEYEISSGAFVLRNRIVSFYKEYRFTALFGLLYATILYALMMTQQLTNTFDGILRQNYYLSDNAELTSGRWVIKYIDRIFQGNHAEPITSLIALTLYIIGFVLVLDLFRIKHKPGRSLCLALFVSSTLISCTLSYRYTSVPYGFAYLCAVLGIYAIIKVRDHRVAVGLAGVFLGLSMGCYQAYIAVFCVVAVFYGILRFNDAKPITAGASSRRFTCYLLRCFFGVCLGAVCYVVPLKLLLMLENTSLSDYNGVNQVSVSGILANLPQRILKTYQYFGAYFFGDKLKINTLQSSGIFYILMVLLAVVMITIGFKTWKMDKKRLPLLLLATIAIPVAAVAYMLMAGDKLELHMTSGLAMIAPLTILLALSCFEEKHVMRIACILICAVLTYGSAMQVWNDQEAMYEGQNACDTMLTQMLSDLSREGLLSTEYEYLFVGVPQENPFFSVSDAYNSANAYAQLGRFWTSGGCGQASYRGLLNWRMGFKLPLSGLNYDDLSGNMNVEQMPIFPENGYIALLDNNLVVVKISQFKPYSGDSKYELK